MSIFSKFPFLEGLPENEYDPVFCLHVPDLETLLTYDMFVEFTRVELPDTMPYMRSLQDELREVKRMGNAGKCLLPTESCAERIDDRFPLPYRNDCLIYVRDFFMKTLNFSMIDMFGISGETDFCFERDFPREDEVNSMNLFFCINCHKYSISECDDYEVAYCSCNDCLDIYRDYNDYCVACECYCFSSDNVSGYFDFMEKHRSYKTMMSLMIAINENKEQQAKMSFKHALIAVLSFPYMNYDATVLMETIYKHEPNFAIRLVLYPDFEVFNTSALQFTSIGTFLTMFRNDNDYCYAYPLWLINDKCMPKYLRVDNVTQEDITVDFLKYNEIRIFGVVDNDSFMRIVPDAKTLVSKTSTESLDTLLDNVYDEGIMAMKIRAYILDNIPHLMSLLIEYWQNKFFTRTDYKLPSVNFLSFMREFVCPKDYDWDFYENKVTFDRLLRTLHNGTLKEIHTSVPVDDSILEAVKTTQELPDSDDYQLLVSIVETVLEQEWCSDLPTVTLFSFMPFTHIRERRLRIIDMIRDKDIHLACLLTIAYEIDTYALATIIDFIAKRRGFNYELSHFSCYWTMITTSREVFYNIDTRVSEYVKRNKLVFPVPMLFEKTREIMERILNT